jgi:GNAT superfamily N-acetyltransferase
MSAPHPQQQFVIRDGAAGDIPACLALDHTGETDMVLQMQMVQPELNRWQISLQEERLPRKIDLLTEPNEARLRAALPADRCFLVAAHRSPEKAELLGYLVMRPETADGVAMITDLIVSRPFRRAGIGSRLLNVARRWAREAGIHRLMIATPTKNYPGIRFCQESGLTFCGFNDRYYPNQDIAVFFTQTVR